MACVLSIMYTQMFKCYSPGQSLTDLYLTTNMSQTKGSKIFANGARNLSIKTVITDWGETLLACHVENTQINCQYRAEETTGMGSPCLGDNAR